VAATSLGSMFGQSASTAPTGLSSLFGGTAPTTGARPALSSVGSGVAGGWSAAGGPQQYGADPNDPTKSIGYYNATTAAANGGNSGTPVAPGSTPLGQAAGYTGASTGGMHAAPATTPTSPASATPSSSAAPTYGTQSGPGLLDQWFNERASGTDPGYE
jgi:hypothetical protein